MEVAIVSGKGGTGKSFVSAAFATLAGTCVLADCDVDAANLYLIFQPDREKETAFTGSREAVLREDVCTGCGLCHNCCRFGALKAACGKVEISKLLCDGCGLCSRICPAGAIEMVEYHGSVLLEGGFRNGQMVYGRLAPGEENSGKLVSLVRETARKRKTRFQMKHIIIDGPPGIGCPAIASISGVDKVLLVTEPSLSARHDMERMLDLCGAFGIPVVVLINKYDLEPKNAQAIERLCCGRGIPIVGKIPFDPLVVDAMVHCRSVAEWVPGSKVVAALSEAYESVFSESAGHFSAMDAARLSKA